MYPGAGDVRETLGSFPLIPLDVDLVNALARLDQIVIVLKV